MEDARTLIEEVEYPPIGAAHKVYIIDEVHMLTNAAFNALLKTIEEPPEYVVFIMATTEAQKVLATILSRCQRFDFHRIPPAVITARLAEVAQAEGFECEKRALEYIAHAADGAMRDALSLLDQCVSFYDKQKLTLDKVLDMLGTVDADIFAKFFAALVAGDVAASIEILDEVLISGKEVMQFVNDFIWYLRNMLLIKITGDSKRVLDVSDENRKVLKKQADETDEVLLMRMISLFSDTYNKLRQETQKRTLLEMTIVRVCYPSSDSGTATLDARVRAIEEKESRLMNAIKLVESGKLVQMASSQNVQQENATPVVKVLPKALPEEIKEIVKNWDSYVPEMPPSVKVFLQGPPEARLSVDETGSLVVVLFNQLHAGYLSKASPNEILKTYLSNKTGKEVNVRVEYMENQQTFEKQLPDLSELIHMEVEEEEDDTDES